MSAETPQSDAQLLHAVRVGDADAYARLRDRHVAAARALAQQLVPAEEAEDVVDESFTRVLHEVGRGGGPESGFRAYLLAVVRRVVQDRGRVENEPLAPGLLPDPAPALLEGSLIAQAYLSLPERWRAVLWHTEVENARAADVAPLLGLAPGEVAALAYRAREGMRQAYIQAYLAVAPPSECRSALGRLGAYVRGGLNRRETRIVNEHVRDCPNCHTVLQELSDVTRGLRTVVGPLVLGAAAPGYLAAISRPPEPPRAVGWVRRQRYVLVGSAATAMAVAAAFAVVSGQDVGHRAAVSPHARSYANEYDNVGPYGESSRTPEGSSGEPPALVPPASPSNGTTASAGTGPQGDGGASAQGGDGSSAGAEGGTSARGDGGSAPTDGGASAQGGDGSSTGTEGGTSARGDGGSAATEGGASARGDGGSAKADGGSSAQGDGGSPAPADPGAGADGNSASPRGEAAPPEKGRRAPVRERAAGGGGPRLRGSVAVVGSLVRGEHGLVAVRIRNAGSSPTGPIYAAVELPPGVTLAGRTAPASETPMMAPAAPGAVQQAAAPGTTSVGAAHPRGGGAVRGSGGDLSFAHAPTSLSGRDQVVPLSPRDTARARSYPVISPTPDGVEAADAPAASAAGPGDRGAVQWTAGRVNAGWRCQAVTGGVRCAREPLAAGKAAPMFLRVHVAQDAPIAQGPRLRVEAGDLRLSARSADGVRRSGTPAVFAADGRVTVRAVGNSLLTCPPRLEGCAAARRRGGDRLDGDVWPLRPLDRDRSARTESSSAARLRLPKGSRVLWAGLYWSATADETGPIKLKAPGRGRYVTVRPSRVSWREMPDGYAYQAFADVTGLVAGAGGSGVWWAADAPFGEPGHAGWSLVVVASDPRAPYGNAVVLDVPRVVGGENPVLRIPLGGLEPAGTPARVELVAWEGDAALRGDRVSLGSGPVVPEGGGRDAGNVFDGSANGTSGMTFGVDVDTLSDTLRARPRLTISGTRDVVMFGVAAVSVRTRS
jgi:DNA-directed RNA polymerase specialized sigma24 family protein